MTPTIEQRLGFLEATAIANLRDFFATSALSELSACSNFDTLHPEQVARRAYRIANAMMEERKKHGNGNI